MTPPSTADCNLWAKQFREEIDYIKVAEEGQDIVDQLDGNYLALFDTESE